MVAPVPSLIDPRPTWFRSALPLSFIDIYCRVDLSSIILSFHFLTKSQLLVLQTLTMSARGWDERSRRGSPQGYTTVKQYRIPRRDEVEERVNIYETDRSSARGSGYEETRIIRKERERTPERVERDIRIERYERSPEPRRYEREYKYERDVERSQPRREPYEVDRYVKTTEYFPPAPRAPVMVPVLPREEEDYQVIRRSEVMEDRQLARREPPPQEEDYYYERRTREFDSDERSRRGRTISPHDSVSRRDYSSDDSMVYIKKEVREERGGSPHHRRHIAEGALAGIGAAEIIRHHRKKEGQDSDSRGSRIGKDLGAAAVGAIGAEVISRVRSHRSKSRHGSPDREGRHRHRHGHERSRSRSRVKQVAALGLGAAAIAAAVGYARHRNNEKQKAGLAPDDRRSRSRTRRNSTSAVPDNDPRNPGHRNTRMAQAGLAGAAVAGLVERARSKSRGGRSRSQSRLRTGIPIVAAGLGSAAIAGLYEKNQAKKRDEHARDVEQEREARRSSRSRSRSSTLPYDGPRAASMSDPGLIEYGEAPIYSNGGIPDYYNRPASQAGYYPPPVDPAMASAAAAGAYGATRVTEVRERETRDRSGERDRRRDYSSESDDGERRRRHRRKKSGEGGRSRSQSRTRELATAGLAAAGAAIGATQYQKRKERKRAEKEKEQERGRMYHDCLIQGDETHSFLEYEAEHSGYDEGPYSPGPYSPLSPPVQNLPAPGHHPDAYYPATNNFPPPPNAQYSPQPAYNPADYAPPNQQTHPDYGYPPQQGYTPPQGVYSPPPVDPYAQAPGRRRGDENVSADPYLNTAYTGNLRDQHNVEEGA